jgi:hypothetical protein
MNTLTPELAAYVAKRAATDATKQGLTTKSQVQHLMAEKLNQYTTDGLRYFQTLMNRTLRDPELKHTLTHNVYTQHRA